MIKPVVASAMYTARLRLWHTPIGFCLWRGVSAHLLFSTFAFGFQSPVARGRGGQATPDCGRSPRSGNWSPFALCGVS